MRKGLTYADVLIVPKYSDIETRTSINVLSEYLGDYRIPIISAPMDYVTGFNMAYYLGKLGAYGIISRFGKQQLPENPGGPEMGVAIGTKDIEWEDLKYAHSICIDVAHGHHEAVKYTLDALNYWYGDTKKIIAGNVATGEGFKFLADLGVDAVRVGIGPGSACSTRENTGVGVPQLTAIQDCVTMRDEWGYYETGIIADGGIQTPGDIVKALAAGADAVMLGYMLAGHAESPGEVYNLDSEKPFKVYQGQSLLGSNGARKAPEGVSGYVPYRGYVKDTIDTLVNYIRSGMSYVGAANLEELKAKAEFIRVSPGTFNESKTRL